MLPVELRKKEILNAVANNNVVIISAETGAGKSTKVPQFLYEAGYKVVVTQPRRLATRTVAERIAYEMGVEIGNEVGYRTAYEKMDSQKTQILFCTDGLQLVKELTQDRRTQVLVIDEVHEWNLNIETLVAWSKKQLEIGWDIKLVLMSATLDAQRLSNYFGDNTPIINIEGRLFPVQTKQSHEDNLIYEIQSLVNENRNILVFQPGKKEIEDTITELIRQSINAVILPLHGELNPDEQNKCFQKYDKSKVIISTNVAQTSITIDDIDAVVDTAIEKHIRLKNGIEGLYFNHISKSDCTQRMGRAGRCKEGLYILCSEKSINEREDFHKAEITRVRLDQLVLRLAIAGFDATELEFFHQPDKETLLLAKQSLKNLGALDQEGIPTRIGKLMSRMPLDVHYARMLIEANKLGVLNEMVNIVAILQNKSLKGRKTTEWRGLVRGSKNDLVAELTLYNIAKTMKPKELDEAGISKKNYFKIKESINNIFESISNIIDYDSNKNKGNKDYLEKSYLVGMVDNIYMNDSYYYHQKNNDDIRTISKDSIFANDNPKWIAGEPLDIEFKDRRGYERSLSLIQNIIEIKDIKILKEIFPHLIKKEDNKIYFKNLVIEVLEVVEA